MGGIKPEVKWLWDYIKGFWPVYHHQVDVAWPCKSQLETDFSSPKVQFGSYLPKTRIMKIINKSPEVLIVKTESIISVVCGFFFIVLSGAAIHSYLAYAGTIQGNIFHGQAAAAIVLLLIAVVFYEKAEFVFDRTRRLLIWSSRRIFIKRAGTVRFDAIKSIVVQGISDIDKSRSLRVAIITDKEPLPLSASYTGASSGKIIKIAEKLNQWVFGESPNLVLENIKVSLEEGSRADAAYSLRKAYPLSMAEAKVILDNPERLDSLPPILTPIDDQDMDSGDREVLLGILALIALVCGPLLLFFGINGYLKGADSEGWPRTEAIITASGLRREIENDEHEFYLDYAYTVNGVQYESNVLYMQAIMNKRKSYAVIPKWYLKDYEVINPHDYRAGTTIAVYYDPDDPRSAVVLRGVSGGIWAMIFTGGFLSSVYLFLARRDLRRKALKKQSRGAGPASID